VSSTDHAAIYAACSAAHLSIHYHCAAGTDGEQFVFYEVLL